MNRLVFNGKEYRSPDEMPPDVRQAFDRICGHLPDANQNGIPDVFEAASDGKAQLQSSTFININGREYRSLEDMPPEVRKPCERLLSAVAGQALSGLMDGGVTAAKIEGTSVLAMPAGHDFQTAGQMIAAPSRASITFGKPPCATDPSGLPNEAAPRSWSGAQLLLTLFCFLVLVAIVNSVVWLVRAFL